MNLIMNIREPVLPGPWYPREPGKIDEFLLPFRKNTPEKLENGVKKSCLAAIAPHAGWFFSGKIAALSISSLNADADTVVVIGGHLPSGASFLFAEEDAIRTPYGPIPVDRELRELLIKKLNGKSDKYQDNTVEVLMPMVHAFFPKAQTLWARFPANLSSYNAGMLLAETCKALERKPAVIGSTDLTHYGVNYDFSPKGSGQAALDWVKNTNDAAFLNAVLEHDPDEVLLCARRDHSSCSVGAVLGAMGFVNKTYETANIEKIKGHLLKYGTSADARNDEAPDSFVGYASIVW